MRGIEVTGNSRIDGATAEIAGHIRDGRVGSHVRYREQEHYDEASRLRDEIMAGTAELTRVTGHCEACLGCSCQALGGHLLPHLCATPDHQHAAPCEQAKGE